MISQTFKLIATYDIVPESQKVEGLFRVELFQSIDIVELHRVRIWAYRYYSVQLAIPKPPLVSHDLFPQEVTYFMDDEELITGIKCSSEEELIGRAKAAIEKFLEVISE